MGLARVAGSGYLGGEGYMRRKYWSNVLAMLGVALLATSFFAKEGWLLGTAIGLLLPLARLQMERGGLKMTYYITMALIVAGITIGVNRGWL